MSQQQPESATDKHPESAVDPAVLVQAESTVLEAAETVAEAAVFAGGIVESDTITRVVLGDKTFILVGTAHISRDSVAEVARVITGLKPDRVCIELDQARYTSMTQEESWKNLDIFKVIREGKGFLLLANLILGSFQKRMGLDGGAKPGEEMREAIRLCGEMGIPFSLIDRDIQVTLRRAWGKSSFWGKNKLLAALLSSAFTSEKLSSGQIEELKKKSALHGMMEELGDYLPSVKGVLIDERDQHLACRLFDEPGSTLVAVVGAGHVPGMVRWLNDLHQKKASSDISSIIELPKTSNIGKILGLVIPLAIVGLLVAGFVTGGWQGGFAKLLTWLLWNGGLAALGTLAAFGHPLSVLAAFVGAPIATLNPFIGVGLFAAGAEAFFRRPRVTDLENLQVDITTMRGFYKNRVTRILLVFVLSSLGGVVGNIISIPAIFPA